MLYYNKYFAAFICKDDIKTVVTHCKFASPMDTLAENIDPSNYLIDDNYMLLGDMLELMSDQIFGTSSILNRDTYNFRKFKLKLNELFENWYNFESTEYNDMDNNVSTQQFSGMFG